MNTVKISSPENIEIPLLLEAIYWRWGHDFRNYKPDSLIRRIHRVIKSENLSTVSALQERILRDESCLQRFLDCVTINVTSMFRDPSFYFTFRNAVVPLLKEHDCLRIWHAGCASGEEVYSMAILLYEEGLLERTVIYATDINQSALNIAKEGIYPSDKVSKYAVDYKESGGKSDFSDYYQLKNDRVKMRSDLGKKVMWAQHNLVTDASFNEFHLILCRNVMIYFNSQLQKRVHTLIFDSLVSDGVLVLGKQESIHLTPYESHYRALSNRERIYQNVE